MKCSEDNLTAVLKAAGFHIDAYAVKVWADDLKGQTPLSCIRKGQDDEHETAETPQPESDGEKEDDEGTDSDEEQETAEAPQPEVDVGKEDVKGADAGQQET